MEAGIDIRYSMVEKCHLSEDLITLGIDRDKKCFLRNFTSSNSSFQLKKGERLLNHYCKYSTQLLIEML